MKKAFFFIIGAVILTAKSLSAGDLNGKKVTTHYYFVQMSEEIKNTVESGGIDAEETRIEDGKVVVQAKGNSYDLQGSLLDTLYEITVNKFSGKGIELLPLNTLEGKIKYHFQYKQCPGVVSSKKAIKSAPDQEVYCQLSVNYHTGTSVGATNIRTGGAVKPQVDIKMQLVDKEGNELFKSKHTHNPKIEIGRKGAGIGDVKTRKASDFNETRQALIKMYVEGLEKTMDEI
jgi:hypothetical protein